MNILILGQGGREHALAEAYAKSKKVKKVFVAPGNGLMDITNKKITVSSKTPMTDFKKILYLVKKEKIDIVDVAQDNLLAEGFVDKLEKAGIKAFGPSKKSSRLEWDKNWSRNFMIKYKLPIPHFKSFNNQKKAIEYVNNSDEKLLFIKASGLALGKGVIRADTKGQAISAIKQMSKFGKSGKTFLIEEGLIGEEFTLFAICDGENYLITKSSQDHKTIFNGNRGPNTGGVGCVSPTKTLNKKFILEVENKIIKPTLLGMKKEKRPYKGILYVGGIITHSPTGGEIKIIEFNSRWGDPEAEAILPSIKTDYLTIIEHVFSKTLNKLKIEFDNKTRLSIAGCAKGYPMDYSKTKGKEIFGLVKTMRLKNITIFGAGILRKNNKFFINGGRVFHLVSTGKNILDARKKAYKAIKSINIDGDNLHYRTDIGWRNI